MRANTSLVGHYLFLYGGQGIYLPFLPLFLAAKGLDSVETGLLLAIGPGTSIIAQIVWGNFADKHNRRKEYLALAVLGTAAVCFALSTARNIGGLALLLFICAGFYSAVSPLTDALTLSAVADTRRFGLFRRWGSLGFAVTAAGGGWFFSRLPIGMFGVVAGSLYALTVPWAVALPNPRFRTRPVPAAFPLAQVLRARGVKVLLVIVLLIMIPYGAYSSFLGWHLQSLGASRLWVGIAWTIAALSEVPVFGLGNRWLKRVPVRMLMAVAATVFAVRWLGYANIRSYPIIVFFQLTQSVSFGLFYLAAVEDMTRLVPAGLRSSAQGLLQAVGFGVGAIVGSAGGGWLLEHSGMGVLYIAMAGLAGLGALGCWLWPEQKA